MVAHVSTILDFISSRLSHHHRVVTLTSSSCCATILGHHKWKWWTRVDYYDYYSDALLLPYHSIRLFQSLLSHSSSPTACPGKRTSPEYRSPVHRLSKVQQICGYDIIYSFVIFFVFLTLCCFCRSLSYERPQFSSQQLFTCALVFVICTEPGPLPLENEGYSKWCQAFIP